MPVKGPIGSVRAGIGGLVLVGSLLLLLLLLRALFGSVMSGRTGG